MAEHFFADHVGRYSSLESVLDSIFVLESVLESGFNSNLELDSESEFNSESELDFEFEI